MPMVRTSSLCLAALTVAIAAFMSANPASAASGGIPTRTTHAGATQAKPVVVAGKVPVCSPGSQRNASGPVHRCAGSGNVNLSEGGCGFLQRCVYLNRTEQLYVAAGAIGVIGAALCAGGFGLTCATAVALVEMAGVWLGKHGGVCPTSKPRLRAQWLPWPQVEGCVS